MLLTPPGKSNSHSAPYFKMVSEAFEEYEIPRILLTKAAEVSSNVAASLHKNNELSSSERESLQVIESVLSFCFAVAETNRPEVLATLDGVSLAHLTVRNRLFDIATRKWENYEIADFPPRGYALARGGTQGKGILVARGEDDPLHRIWVRSMEVLQALLRCSSHWTNMSETRTIRGQLLSMSVEFIRLFQRPLVACLRYCGSRLTVNALHEATQILALTSELCKRGVQEAFARDCGSSFNDFHGWAKFVFVCMSRFLGATGAARELFVAIEEYETSDPNAENMPFSSGPLHPLLIDGLPSAKHEAVKYSHYASKLIEKITKEDFAAASDVPEHLRKLSRDRPNDSDLEKTCRLAVTNAFTLQVEHAAAQCLSQAVSLLWRTHPSSRSFQMFSEMEATTLDSMQLVQNGVIIAFRPSIGEAILPSSETGAIGFEHLRFGRVQARDTVKRTWLVSVIKRDEFGSDKMLTDTEVVQARQLAGVEDVSMRKPITSFAPAPNSMVALESAGNLLGLGHLILSLRWCHQQSLATKPNQSISGSVVDPFTSRLAEQLVVLIGAELSLHSEISSQATTLKDKSRLYNQVFDLFAEKVLLNEIGRKEGVLGSAPEGRLKGIISRECWAAVYPQVEREIKEAWKERITKEKRRSEKRPNEHSFFAGVRRTGHSHKSAFRGLG